MFEHFLYYYYFWHRSVQFGCILVRGIKEISRTLHSANMAATPPPGAYVIRNRATSTVIHVDGGNVTTTPRNEERHREQQIWWIEAIPGLDDFHDEAAAVYRITNIAKVISLDIYGGHPFDITKAAAYRSHGAPRQHWKLQRQLDYTDG